MKKQAKIAMPNYTKSGYRAVHPMHKTDKDNKIKAMPGGEKRYGSQGPQYRPESVASNKRCLDSKIKGYSAPHQNATNGVNVRVTLQKDIATGLKIKGKSFGQDLSK